MVKTREEMECIQRVRRSAKRPSSKSSASCVPGAVLGDVMATYSSVAANESAYFDHFIYDPRGNGITSDPKLRIQENSLFFFDYGVIFQRSYSDSGKTIFLGGMSKEQSDIYNALWHAVEETKDEIRPGTLPSSILDMLAKKLADRGITKIYAHGHAIGLEPREYPVIMRSDYGKFSDGIVSETTDISAGRRDDLQSGNPLRFAGRGVVPSRKNVRRKERLC